MKYYFNNLSEVKVRTDATKNEAYIKNKDGIEQVAPKGSKLVADTIIENNLITKEEYDK